MGSPYHYQRPCTSTSVCLYHEIEALRVRCLAAEADRDRYLARAEAAEAEVVDWRETHADVIGRKNEWHDAQHCSCVPHLHREIERLRAEKAAWCEAAFLEGHAGGRWRYGMPADHWQDSRARAALIKEASDGK